MKVGSAVQIWGSQLKFTTADVVNAVNKAQVALDDARLIWAGKAIVKKTAFKAITAADLKPGDISAVQKALKKSFELADQNFLSGNRRNVRADDGLADEARPPHRRCTEAEPRRDLRAVNNTRVVLEEFRPLTQSLGWRLADLFWAEAGLRPFIENEVPFVVTSNGRLSEDAAAVFVASCADTRRAGPLVVLELGAGTGLFARYFLDAVRAISTETGVDVYDRLVYIVSDRSARTVEQWSEARLFEDHAPQVVRAICDALRPSELLRRRRAHPRRTAARGDLQLSRRLTGSRRATRRARMRGALCSHELLNDSALLAQYTRLTPAEIRALAASDDPARQSELIPLVSLLQLEVAFLRTTGPTLPYAEDALALTPDAPRAVANYGAMQCIDACFDLLAEDGFLLVNDYGPVRPDQVADNALVQRFGRTTALGINFPLLDRFLVSRGCTVLLPEGDDDWPIHARLICRRELPRTAEVFQARFALDAHRARKNRP